MAGTAFLRYVDVVGEFVLDVGPPARRCGVANTWSKWSRVTFIHQSRVRVVSFMGNGDGSRQSWAVHTI